MHEYNPSRNDLPMEYKASPQEDYTQFTNALVTLSNKIARATTKWTLQESKLFLMGLSKIKTRDENNWVTLNKADISEMLELGKNISKLRDMFKKIMTKSYIQLDGKEPQGDDDIEWLDGFLLTSVKSTKKTVSIQFNQTYLPLLDDLTRHFTSFYLKDIISMKQLSSFKLYIYLSSWHNKDYAIQNRIIRKEDISKVFGLKEDAYWRNFGTEKAKFDFAHFEERILNVAVDEINNLNKKGICDLRIVECNKIKKGHFVKGYDIKYIYTKDGHIKTYLDC